MKTMRRPRFDILRKLLMTWVCALLFASGMPTLAFATEPNPKAGASTNDAFDATNCFVAGGLQENPSSNLTCAPFQVKILYNGSFSDKTKYSTVELTIHSTAAVSAVGEGSALTYKIEGGGTDSTENAGTLNGDKMVEFDSNGWAYIKAGLKEGSSIRITGMFGPLSGDERETISTAGLADGLEYYVIEGNPYDYRPTGYVYVGDGTSVDPRVSDSGMTKKTVSDSPIQNFSGKYDGSMAELPAFALFVEGTTTGSDTTVFVVNVLDGNKVAPTGILIDNLPYILMIGVPVAVFIALFALRHRRVAAE